MCPISDILNQFFLNLFIRSWLQKLSVKYLSTNISCLKILKKISDTTSRVCFMEWVNRQQCMYKATSFNKYSLFAFPQYGHIIPNYQPNNSIIIPFSMGTMWTVCIKPVPQTFILLLRCLIKLPQRTFNWPTSIVHIGKQPSGQTDNTVGTGGGLRGGAGLYIYSIYTKAGM